MDKLKVAVVGLGKMGLLHSSILGVIPSVEVVALCDKSFVLRRIAKKLFKHSVVVDDVEKLRDLSLDCAYVTAPIPAHFPIVNDLYSKSSICDVFVEKTLASSWNKANQLCALFEKNNGVNMVGYMKRFSVTFSKAKNLLDENVLGELESFKGSAYSSDFANSKRASKGLSRGGVLSDLGSHIIDLALWFFGDFEVENAMIKSLVDEASEDEVSFRVKRLNLTGEFDISWCKDNYRLPNFALTVQGSKGSLAVNDSNIVLESPGKKPSILYRPALNDNVGFLLGEPEYFREDEHFIKSILNGDKAEPSFRTASKVDYIIDNVKKEAQKTCPNQERNFC
jgi:predicted dehydrogenase